MQGDAVQVLTHLIQVDIDAVRAYSQAIERCDDPVVAHRLSDFRADHERHIRNLGEAIRRLGATPPDRPDTTGFAIAGFTGLAAAMGLASALTVMKSNEVVTNDAYEQALAADLPGDMRILVEGNRADERRHLRAIEEMLADMVPAGRVLSAGARLHGGVTSAWVNHPWMVLAAGVGVGVLVAALVGRRRGWFDGLARRAEEWRGSSRGAGVTPTHPWERPAQPGYVAPTASLH